MTIFKPAKGDAVASISCVSDLSLPDEDEGKAGKASTNGSRNGRANGAQPKLELEYPNPPSKENRRPRWSLLQSWL